MLFDNPNRYWVPYLVAFIGFIFSCFMWAVLQFDLYEAIGLRPSIEIIYNPWLAFILGLIISVLVATIIKISQLARARALSLEQINEDLKKEIAERIHAEETKRKLEIALLQGQKLQAMGTLAGGIAHDFNNILYAIIGYAEILREDADKDSITYKNLGKMLEAGHRGQDIVARILSFSRRQHHQFTPINLKNTIEAALALLRPTIPASVIINFEMSSNLGPKTDILGNQTQIHQILINLINNAVDAMDGEGTINILLDRVSAHDEILKNFSESPTQNYFRIDISDTGHGMTQNTIKRIFDPFFTTKEVGKGTGLGLSIAHSITKDHKGEISVHSRLGFGTTFTILLPEYTEE